MGRSAKPNIEGSNPSEFSIILNIERDYLMNIFSKLAEIAPFRFGTPLGDIAAIDRRKTALAQIRRGNGFRLYVNKPASRVGGKTRSERKAVEVERANASVATYHANLKAAREQGLIGLSYVSPQDVAKLLTPAAEKPKRKPRAKKVEA